jgi:hypothetical protein
VAGCPRSGTSALCWALAAHRAYWTSVETHFFYYLLRDDWTAGAHAKSSGEGSWIATHEVSGDEFLGHIGAGLDRLMQSRADGRQWVDGSPENILVGQQLLRMYPRAHMFHMVRDPLAVCLSMLTSGFAEPWASDLDEAIGVWKHYVATGLELAAAFPDRVTQIHQEDMRADPAGVAEEIGRRLGLAEVDAVAAFLANETINSSTDRASYVELSPFRQAVTFAADADAFRAAHGARIRAETAALATRCGYGCT